ncbi:MAG TPA: hypothetical protein VLS89_00850 [Candidatus Nanopelagicales bacterium]|nr:hypothetical protein [Candidatus Nanopelagicales bacterium]
MDPALSRLVLNDGCRIGGPGGGLYYNPQSGFDRCQPDHASFAKLIAQYGFAIASPAMHSARTTGYGGFELGIEASYTKIDANQDYWQKGTQGPQDPTTKTFSYVNSDPDSLLQHYALKVRKGFPFGLEIASAVGFLGNTSIITAGADVRMSLFEGFRTGVPAIFPELAVGGSVRTITGTEEFQLTVAGVDAQISKPLPIAGTVVFTPYVGYQWIRIFGDSGLIDMTPNTDAVDYCDFQGTNTPALPGAPENDGQPACGTGSSADFNNTVVFDAVRLSRHRINFGGQLRFQMVKFGVHFITDLMSAEDANQGEDYEIDGVNKFAGVGNQWTLAFDLGAVF